MEKVHINLINSTNNSYDIFIGSKIFKKLAEDLKTIKLAHSYAIITDSNVKELYANKLLNLLRKVGINFKLIYFKAGEKQKTREVKSYLEDKMLESQFGRDSAIIALGGGVVGDIAGFVAATYARGIPYIQIPTTLVACVDSSIGGKTAVDTSHGKNLIGSFHQPYAVYIDIDTLHTLDKMELKEGLAEVIKYGVIADAELFYLLEKRVDDVFKYNIEVLTEIIERSCKIKANVVEKDEKESNFRKILNFGHTIGHAIENLSNYSMTHGNAISIGMVIEGKIAAKLGLWSNLDLKKLESLLNKTGLPTQLPSNSNHNEIINAMKIDKKTRKGKIEMSLPSSIGNMTKENESFSIRINEKTITNVLKQELL